MSSLMTTLTIDLAGYWHAGTGRADGAGADAVVTRDHDGLPVLPGSHIRGLWRHGLRLWCHLGAAQPELVDRVFGRAPATAAEQTSASDSPAETRFETERGRIRIGDARMPKPFREALRHSTRASLRDELYTTLQSTAIGDDDLVRSRTLRSIEVAVPMRLVSDIELRDLDAESEAALRGALSLIRRVGKHRSRGLGRARFTLEGGR